MCFSLCIEEVHTQKNLYRVPNLSGASATNLLTAGSLGEGRGRAGTGRQGLRGLLPLSSLEGTSGPGPGGKRTAHFGTECSCAKCLAQQSCSGLVEKTNSS